MNPYNFALLFFSFCTFLISLFIWLKRRDKVGAFYFIFSVSVVIWGIAWAILLNQEISYDIALACSRIGHADAAMVAVLWVHFTKVFTGRDRQWQKLLICLYAIAILICAFSFTHWFVPRVGPVMDFKYYTKPGPIFHVFVGLYSLCVLLGFIQLLMKIKRSSGEERIQFNGFFFATLAGFLGGSPVIIPVYEINFPQQALFLMPIYPFVMAYFMTRYKLFDLDQVAQAFQREKLATIGLLAASINHEIRNPLYAAKGLLDNYVELTKEGLKQKDPMEVAERTRAQIERALDVITKLNRFAKPITDTNTQSQTASVQEALQNVLDLVSYEFELDKIHIKNNLHRDLPLIQADQRQLEEIFFNLIVNACHAMGKTGGELTISCHSRESGNLDPRHIFGEERQVLPEKCSAHWARALKHMRLCRSAAPLHSGMTGKIQIIIQDTGTGIPQEHLKHLFEPFHTTKGDQGTGLGLYITKQLVERNNGRISVKSQEGRGTNFVLEFKCTK